VHTRRIERVTASAAFCPSRDLDDALFADDETDDIGAQGELMECST
jgi:hypothetical protein